MSRLRHYTAFTLLVLPAVCFAEQNYSWQKIPESSHHSNCTSVMCTNEGKESLLALEKLEENEIVWYESVKTKEPPEQVYSDTPDRNPFFTKMEAQAKAASKCKGLTGHQGILCKKVETLHF